MSHSFSLLFQRAIAKDPHARMLYIVFGKKAQEEARTSGKFPKQNMAILTSHAYARRKYFGTHSMMNFQPQDDHTLDDIERLLNLEAEISSQLQGTYARSNRQRPLPGMCGKRSTNSNHLPTGKLLMIIFGGVLHYQERRDAPDGGKSFQKANTDAGPKHTSIQLKENVNEFVFRRLLVEASSKKDKRWVLLTMLT